MSDYGATDTTTTTLGANQFPVSAVFVPGDSKLTTLEGGNKGTDGNGKTSASASMLIKDGNDVTQGATTDVAVVGDNPGSLSAKLRGLTKIFNDVWDSVNHHIKVDGSGVTQPVSGTFWQSSATGTPTSVAGSVTSVVLLVSNASRKAAYIYNESSATLYLGLFAHTSLTTSLYTVQVPPSNFFEVPTSPVYTGEISGIWATATGTARITEMS